MAAGSFSMRAFEIRLTFTLSIPMVGSLDD
jgi:hypothetical protein